MAWTPVTSTTTANLNLRSSPTMGASILTVMPNSSSIRIMGGLQNGWYPVLYNGQQGWASAQFMTPPSSSAPSVYGTSTTKTPGSTLNLRQGPSTGTSVLGSIPHGATITLTGAAQNGWFPVSYGGKTGYASAQFINPFTPTPATSAPTTPPETGAPPPTTTQPGSPAASNPFFDPGSTFGGSQNWYDTPLAKQTQDFDAEWEKAITEQGFGGFTRKSNVARNLIDRAKSGFNAATVNNPNLDPRGYINETLGPQFLRNAMASMSPGQLGDIPGLMAPRARWIDR